MEKVSNRLKFLDNTLVRTLLVLVACIFVIVFVEGIHNPAYQSSIVDVSWPNCSTKANYSFSSGFIGVTGGLDFSPNPCLAKETTWFSNYNIYMNTGYPGRFYSVKYASYPRHCKDNQYGCLGFNFGYNAAEYAINYSYSQVAHSSSWWIDVETENSWTLHPLINRAVLEGAMAAVEQIPFIQQIGIYSTTGQWDFLTKYWHNDLPVWIGTGSSSELIANFVCHTNSFTGGPILYTQYTQILDTDISCINR